MTNDTTQTRKTRAALLSVVSNTLLVALKLAVGMLIGSVSVISEAIHSAVDLVAALIALFAVRTSSKPADHQHPFGHGKVENISAAVEALLIFVAAGWIIFEAVHKLNHPEPLTMAGWGAAVMLVSAVANILVSRHLFRVGRETDSLALQGDAWHLRTDVYTSLGVMAALGVVAMGSRLFPGTDLHWVDPAAAVAVALLILKAAFQLTVESTRDLLDATLPTEDRRIIEDRIARFSPGVRGCRDLRTRKSGSQRFAEVTLIMDSGMSVESSHRITESVSEAINEALPDTSVTIHVEPCNGDCDPPCTDECFLDEDQRRRIRRKRDRRRSRTPA